MNWVKTERVHNSVLIEEVLQGLKLQNQAPLKKQIKIIDATVGTGGHSLAIVNKGVNLLGIEEDPEMLKVAQSRLTGEGIFKLIHGNFRDIDLFAEEQNFKEVDGIIFDLGVANPQLISLERGFSFVNPDAPLDMRLDKEKQGVTGADLLNVLREDQLKTLFSRVLLRSQTNYLVKRIVGRRENQQFKTVGDFLEICRTLRIKPTLNPATLPFLALRIAVNSELENLQEALPKAFSLLKKEGRLLVITFHSLEGKIVKDFFKKTENEGKALIISQGQIVPKEEEVINNPRARSAKLSILEKK